MIHSDMEIIAKEQHSYTVLYDNKKFNKLLTAKFKLNPPINGFSLLFI